MLDQQPRGHFNIIERLYVPGLMQRYALPVVLIDDQHNTEIAKCLDQGQ